MEIPFSQGAKFKNIHITKNVLSCASGFQGCLSYTLGFSWAQGKAELVRWEENCSGNLPEKHYLYNDRLCPDLAITRRSSEACSPERYNLYDVSLYLMFCQMSLLYSLQASHLLREPGLTENIINLDYSLLLWHPLPGLSPRSSCIIPTFQCYVLVLDCSSVCLANAILWIVYRISLGVFILCLFPIFWGKLCVVSFGMFYSTVSFSLLDAVGILLC